jgi:heat shock protein HslJ
MPLLPVLSHPVTSSLPTARALLLAMACAAPLPAWTATPGTPPGLRVETVTPASHPFQTLYCAGLPVQLRFLGGALELQVGTHSRMLLPAISASGARYEAPGDPATEYWGKGALATITWSGQTLPICAPAGTIIAPFRASGNEPFWALAYDGWQVTLSEPGRPDQVLNAQITNSTSHGQTLSATEGAVAITAQVNDALCVDTMTGMPYPQQVTLRTAGGTQHGCGGDPARLLQGVRWQITQIGSQAVPAGITASLVFLPDGRLAGSTGCNRVSGSYQLSGEGLAISGLAGTRMACADNAMAIESRLNAVLPAVRGFAIESGNHLVLETSDTRVTARPVAALP